jgi:hypothetical protein
MSNWFGLVVMSYLHQPSSAACERVFSVLKGILSAEKGEYLDDYIKAAYIATMKCLSGFR